MTQDEIYNTMQAERRAGKIPLQALYIALNTAGVKQVIIPSQDVLLIECENMLSQDIKIIDLLIYAINYRWKIVSEGYEGAKIKVYK